MVVPTGLSTLIKAVTGAAAVATTARAAVVSAEEREEKLRGELADAADAAALHRLLDRHAERDRLAGEAGEVASLVGRAEAEHDAAIGRWTRRPRRPG